MLLAESMSKHTTIKIGGNAEILATAHEPEDIINWTSYVKDKDMPLSIIGNGSNLLVSDAGVEGLVMKIYNPKGKLNKLNGSITVFSGYPLIKLISWAANEGLGGIEDLAGIPGTLGGAVYMNAGARDCEIADVVQWITVLDLNSKKQLTLTKDELKFSYRHSSLQNSDLVILDVNIKLGQNDPSVLKKRVSELLIQRKKVQPVDFPNSGSIFKNPPNLSAGRLIEEVGLKGYRIGDAQIAEKHANFIINLGEAKATEVMELINMARKEVFKKKNIELQPEVRILGGGLKLEEV